MIRAQRIERRALRMGPDRRLGVVLVIYLRSRMRRPGSWAAALAAAAE
ncbi:MAG: hypothetical protein ACK4MV_16410 [Beijerinckiaceae bacterium]